jgi:hypothetical protein
LRRARPTQLGLERSEFWPQDNEAAEEDLRRELQNIPQSTVYETRKVLLLLDSLHGSRRTWVWAQLGQAPLAKALQYLARLAELTETPLTGESVSEIADAYLDWGWQVDQFAIEAQIAVNRQDDIEAVKAAVRAIYKSWLEGAAEALQNAISSGYPHKAITAPEKGTCILFSDALRMDAGRTLALQIQDAGFQSEVDYHLAALPTITSTAKPAILDIGAKITGQGGGKLTPRDKTKNSILTAEGFRKILADKGYQILKDNDLGDPSGIAWTEIGEIDTYGHNHGCTLARHLSGEIDAIKDRVQILLDYGWKRVYVVTDHGWLLLPGELPKVHIPEHLTEVRKGRCALLKSTSSTEYDVVPWFWDQNVSIVVAPGIKCFEAGKEYEHGGISPQECITPMIKVAPGDQVPFEISIENIRWRGLRCVATVVGSTKDVLVDIRSKAADPMSSLVGKPQAADADGNISMLVEDEDQLGAAAFMVALSSSGSLLAQTHVTIGE